jgi:hypothetical protein
VIWGGELPNENAFPSVEAANPMLSLIVRHWNSIISELETDGVHVPSFLRSKRERCRGGNGRADSCATQTLHDRGGTSFGGRCEDRD